jgi:hypothetical protein
MKTRPQSRRKGGPPKTLWQKIKGFFQNIVWDIKSYFLAARLDSDTVTRGEAEEAVAKVVYKTNIAPDCVSATVVRGGPCIYVKHDNAHEAFIHKTYAEAADEAINWLNRHTGIVRTSETSGMNRQQRRAFDAKRKQKRGEGGGS